MKYNCKWIKNYPSIWRPGSISEDLLREEQSLQDLQKLLCLLHCLYFMLPSSFCFPFVSTLSLPLNTRLSIMMQQTWGGAVVSGIGGKLVVVEAASVAASVVESCPVVSRSSFSHSSFTGPRPCSRSALEAAGRLTAPTLPFAGEAGEGLGVGASLSQSPSTGFRSWNSSASSSAASSPSSSGDSPGPPSVCTIFICQPNLVIAAGNPGRAATVPPRHADECLSCRLCNGV